MLFIICNIIGIMLYFSSGLQKKSKIKSEKMAEKQLQIKNQYL